MMIFIFILAGAYLLGSMPNAVWIGKAFKGIDLRMHGSGNAGATNAFRVLGKPIGIVVLILDMLKGFLAVKLIVSQQELAAGSEAWMLLSIALGILAVVGHIFPVFANFKGGKGVATVTGVGLALFPQAVLAAMAVYLVVFLIGKISALASLSAAFSYPLWIWFVFDHDSMVLKWFSLGVLLLVLITHRSNIKRLLKGEEGALFRKTS